MGLKAPGIMTFMFSVILTVIVLISKFFSATIPGLTGNEFWALLKLFSPSAACFVDYNGKRSTAAGCNAAI